MENPLKPGPPSLYTKIMVVTVTVVITFAILNLLGLHFESIRNGFGRERINMLFVYAFCVIFFICYMIVACLTAILEGIIAKYFKTTNKEE